MRRMHDLIAMAGMMEWLHDLPSVFLGWVEAWGYWGVVLLMAMESSILPVPSEIVVPPAAVIASQDGASMSFWGVVLAGTLGSYCGSVIMYAVSRSVGRAVILRYGKYFFMPPHKVETAERFMQQYSTAGIFFSRFLPVVRHLISIPAGIARVNFGMFSLVTILGSGIWCWVLAWFGDKIGREHPGILDSPQELMAAVKDESHIIVAGVLLLAVLYGVMKYLTRPKKG